MLRVVWCPKSHMWWWVWQIGSVGSGVGTGVGAGVVGVLVGVLVGAGVVGVLVGVLVGAGVVGALVGVGVSSHSHLCVGSHVFLGSNTLQKGTPVDPS